MQCWEQYWKDPKPNDTVIQLDRTIQETIYIESERISNDFAWKKLCMEILGKLCSYIAGLYS